MSDIELYFNNDGKLSILDRFIFISTHRSTMILWIILLCVIIVMLALLMFRRNVVLIKISYIIALSLFIFNILLEIGYWFETESLYKGSFQATIVVNDLKKLTSDDDGFIDDGRPQYQMIYTTEKGYVKKTSVGKKLYNELSVHQEYHIKNPTKIYTLKQIKKHMTISGLDTVDVKNVKNSVINIRMYDDDADKYYDLKYSKL